VKLSTCGFVRKWRSACLLAMASLPVGLVALVFVGSARGYTAEITPQDECYAAGRAAVAALEVKLAPSNETTVQAGRAVTFSGYSEAPLTFAVASSAALLSSPDIESTLASEQPQPSGGPLYSLTSTKASATPGTVYWDASFSNDTLPECAEFRTTLTTKARTLMVLPAPASPTQTLSQTPPPPSSPPVQVSISTLGSFHLAHGTVTYGIHCTESCHGDTDYDVLAVRHHGRAVRVPKLALDAEPVSIAAAMGGSEAFAHKYRGSSLRMLKSLLGAGDAVELQISVKVTGAAGGTVQAQRTVRLP
jgi:hypothetical protein